MRKFYVSTMGLLAITSAAQAQTTSDTLENKKQLQEVVVSGVRASDKNPVTFTNLNKKEIEQQNFGQDVPFLLNLTPSTVVSSDAGAGVGYTGIRIRGTDPTRTNVTINGVPINDAESHGAFWVDLPDFASSMQSMQVQRGVGTSSNGAGAFGASINVQSDMLTPKAYGEVANSYGSFNTWKSTVKAGTGLLDNKWAFDARLSKIQSDGYIDRASSDLKSFFISGAYYGEKSLLKLNVFSGKEITYQAWNGVPQEKLDAGDRTFNEFTYKNQVDNYQQDYYQLFYTYIFNKYWKANVGLHYTRGKGYYEEFRENEPFTYYKLKDKTVVDGDTLTNGNFIRRRWLDNYFYGAIYALNYEKEKFHLTLGGGINQYDGKNYGELIWAQYTLGSNINDHFYDGKSLKTDFNLYGKAGYRFTEKLEGYMDVQGHFIDYKLSGEEYLGYGYYQPYDFHLKYNFFNPKAGITYTIEHNANIYAYAGIAHKEPTRSDIVQASSESMPKPETLINYELGYRKNWKRSAFSVNFYYMDYRDQLVLTGQVNDVGAYNRVNVARSYRAGIEVTAGIQLLEKLRWQATLTYSQNKIKQYDEYLDNYDATGENYLGQQVVHHQNVAIALSPDWIASSLFTYTLVKGLDLNLVSKYVGRQYLDNTEEKSRSLNAFFVNDLRCSYSIPVKQFFRAVQIGILVNNIFNVKYEPNGYTYAANYAGVRSDYNYYYPQAGTNYLANLVLKF